MSRNPASKRHTILLFEACTKKKPLLHSGAGQRDLHRTHVAVWRVGKKFAQKTRSFIINIDSRA